jgi:hypothetical protein
VSLRRKSIPLPEAFDQFSGQWSYSSTHDDIASIKQSRPYLIIAQYSVDLVPIFLRDRNLLLLLLLLLLRLLFLVILKAAMISLPIIGHDDVTPVTHVSSFTPIQGLVVPRQTFVTVGQVAL